jgi:hypothetical protein
MVGKAQKSHGASCGLYGGYSNGVPPIHFFQAEHSSKKVTFFHIFFTFRHCMCTHMDSLKNGRFSR